MMIPKLNCLCLAALLLLGCLLPGEGLCRPFKPQGSPGICGLCGQPLNGHIVRYENGSAYHLECHATAVKCSICGLPIDKDQKVRYDAHKNRYHAACYQKAPLCVECGQPITAGQPYREEKNGDLKWHAACFEKAAFCGITGQYIRPGVKTVRVGTEIFIKSEYDKSRKCLISALPLANHGRFIVNRRSKSFVLEKYQKRVHQCYSCGDWLPGGYSIKDDFFLCRFCYQHAVTTTQSDKYLEEARHFFRAHGIRVPAHVAIVILQPGQLVSGQENTDIKGACNTEVTVAGEDVSYRHTVEILYGLNIERFKTVLVHELSHAIIAEEIKYVNGKEQTVPYEEGRCEFAAYTFARQEKLPDYIIEGFALNRVSEYRDGFLYFKQNNPASLKSVLSE